MRQEQLQPPRPSDHQISLDDEFRELEAQRKQEWCEEAMRGAGEFWHLDAYDCEQYVDIFPVIAAMMRLQNTSDEAKWRGLMTAVRGLVDEYTERRCER